MTQPECSTCHAQQAYVFPISHGLGQVDVCRPPLARRRRKHFRGRAGAAARLRARYLAIKERLD